MPADTENKAYDPDISAASPVIDPGASYHMTCNPISLLNVVPCDDHYVDFADGRSVDGKESGDLRMGWVAMFLTMSSMYQDLGSHWYRCRR